MLKSSLCDYSEVYILVKGTISVSNTAADDADANNDNIKIKLKISAPFTDCMSKVNNTQGDNTEDIEVVILMYNLIEYSDNYSKHQCCKDESALSNNNIVNFNGANNTDLFNFKVKTVGQTGKGGRNNAEIVLPLKYSWRTFEILLINCKINVILTWSANCVISSSNVINQAAIIVITDTKLYVSVVTLSTQDNAKLLEQLESGFKRTSTWNIYKSKVTTQAQNQI